MVKNELLNHSGICISFAFFSIVVDLVMFFRQVFHQENTEASNNANKWMGTIYIFALFSTFHSDPYMGCYLNLYHLIIHHHRGIYSCYQIGDILKYVRFIYFVPTLYGIYTSLYIK